MRLPRNVIGGWRRSPRINKWLNAAESLGAVLARRTRFKLEMKRPSDHAEVEGLIAKTALEFRLSSHKKKKKLERVGQTNSRLFNYETLLR